MRSATKKKLGKDPEYLEFIRAQPCCVCIRPWMVHMTSVCYSNVQKSPTEAAHVGDRGMGQKCPDREAIPLCGVEHHREGKESAHRLQKAFWRHYGIDRDTVIAEYNRRFDAGDLI